jgi:hypothetical protein
MANPYEPAHNKIKQELINKAKQGAGLPKEEERPERWSRLPWTQNPPHRLHYTQSQALVKKIDYAVIGSGITGCSVTWNLLTQDRT